MDERASLVEMYFRTGLSNQEILTNLANLHGIIISIRTLKRMTKQLGLYRRRHQSEILDVAVFILEQLQGHAQMNGYRWMHERCIQNGFVVSLNQVRLLLSVLDSRNVEMRRRHRLQRRSYYNAGPNDVWHVDGYDKLKPYGISVHGCIDGYSRSVIWLNACTSNKQPAVVANFFVTAVDEVKGCPARVRADDGTENSYIRQMQIFFRSEHTEAYHGEKSFVTGKSTANQRIEWFWGLLRKEGVQFWLNIFQDLKDRDLFDGGFLDRNLAVYCFLPLIQVTYHSTLTAQIVRYLRRCLQFI